MQSFKIRNNHLTKHSKLKGILRINDYLLQKCFDGSMLKILKSGADLRNIIYFWFIKKELCTWPVYLGVASNGKSHHLTA